MREEVREDGDGRHRDGRIERQPRIDRDEHDACADEDHQALQRLDDSPADEVAHRIDVVRRARDHLARGVAVVERSRVADVGVVEHPAQSCLDGDTDARGGEAARVVDPELERRDEDDRAQIGQQQAPVATVDRIVDRALDEDRNGEGRGGEGQRACEAEQDQAPLLPPQRVETAQSRPEREISWVDGIGCDSRGDAHACCACFLRGARIGDDRSRRRRGGPQRGRGDAD